jgi:hypothetical protein
MIFLARRRNGRRGPVGDQTQEHLGRCEPHTAPSPRGSQEYCLGCYCDAGSSAVAVYQGHQFECDCGCHHDAVEVAI